MNLFKSLLLTFVTIGSFSAFADDGGYIGIKVHEINATQVDDKGVITPVKIPNMTINLNGNEAAKLLKILPANLSVVTGMYPKFAKTFNSNFRSLGIAAGDKGPALLISCSNGDVSYPTGKGEPTLKKYKDGTHCDVSVFSDAAEELNLDYRFNPAKDICGQK